ncbi:J domain-containing protein [Paenibacillus sp. GCM10027626]|uniref:J domain-containing protein n=1 Tax=Paenibacillus sp. GCM10027626 TaxID=3273411 RepID=UPI00363840D8
MDKVKEAYALLGLSEDATKEDVEKRYFILLRQSRAKDARGAEGEGEHGADFEAINQAYKTILAYEDNKIQEEFNQNQYGKYKKMAGVAQKTDHFFHYYKFHLLGAIVLIVLIIVGVNSYMDRQAEKERLAKLPPIDVSVMFHGEFMLQNQEQDTTALEEALLAKFPEWKRVSAAVTYDPAEPKNEFDMASVQKALLSLITDKSDVYILDKNSFAKLSKQGLLRKLDDEYNERLKPLLASEADAYKSRVEEDTEDHIYAIDITGSPLIKELPVAYNNMVVGIRTDAQHVDNALLFIERMIAGK